MKAWRLRLAALAMVPPADTRRARGALESDNLLNPFLFGYRTYERGYARAVCYLLVYARVVIVAVILPDSFSKEVMSNSASAWLTIRSEGASILTSHGR